MSLSMMDLGEDILCSDIAPLLSTRDIFNLSLVSKKLYGILSSNGIYHLLYLKTFGSKPVPLNLSKYNWKEIFELRCNENTRIYTWGSSGMGRLGYLLNSVPEENLSNSTFLRSVHTPTNIPNFNGIIIDDIGTGGFCFVILTHDGSLYHTGYSWRKNDGSCLTPGPSSPDYRPSLIAHSQTIGSRRLLTGVLPMPLMTRRYDRTDSIPTRSSSSYPRETPSTLTRPPENLNINEARAGESSSQKDSFKNKREVKESEFISKLKLPQIPELPNRRIVSMSSGREHILALDNYHNIITWDSGNTSDIGVQLHFPGIQWYEAPKISAGWNLLACYIKGVGLVVWYSRTPVTQASFESANPTSTAKYIIVPGTEGERIIDFHIGCDFVLYIKQDGLLHRFDLNAAAAMNDNQLTFDPSYPVLAYNEWLSKHDTTKGEVKFTKLSGCYNNFAVFTNDGMVLLGNKASTEEDSNDPPLIIPQLQKAGFIDLKMGDYHYLALNDKGDLYSWGVESNNCGCLGLGSKELFVEKSPSIVHDLGIRRGMEVEIPSIVKKPTPSGKWLAITAAGWHSGGIYAPM